MISEPPLLIIAVIPDDLDLAQLPWPDAARGKISINSAKFRNLDMVEVIIDAMPFLLARLTAAEIGERFAADEYDLLCCDLPNGRNSAICVALTENLSSAKHLTAVNRRLLLLGKWIGESLDATAVAWTPSRMLASFTHFDKTIREYLADGPVPALLRGSSFEA